MLSEKLDYQGSSDGAVVPISGPMPIRKKTVVVEQDPSLLLDFEPPEQAPTPPLRSPTTSLVPGIDLLLVAMAIVKVQAMLRGRRVRRDEKFSKVLERLHLQKQRVRSVILIQRLARGSIVRRQVRSQKQAVRLLSRAYKKFKFRAKIEVHMEWKRTERPARTVITAAPLNTSKPALPKHQRVVPQDVDKFRGGVKSVSVLQRRFRDKQAQRAAQKAETAAIRKLIKLQSFLRGRLVRKHVKELTTRATQSPTVVCLRIASSGPGISNQLCHHEHHHCENQRCHSRDCRNDSSCCVYLMPERVGQAAHVSQKRSRTTRHRLEEAFDQVRNSKAHVTTRRTHAWDATSGSQNQLAASSGDSQADDYAFGVELRRLMPSHSTTGDTKRLTRSSPRANVGNAALLVPTTHRLSQAFPGFTFDPMRKKGKQSPPGVEYVSEVNHRIRGLDQIPEPHANAPSAQRPSMQQQHCCHVLDAAESASSNAFRRHAFYTPVGISRTQVRSSPVTLPELLRGAHHPLRRAETLGSRPDQTFLCCLLPAATGNTSKQRLNRDSRVSISLGLSSQQSPSPKCPSTSAATTSAPGSQGVPSPSALAPHRKLTVPSASVAP